MEDLPQAKMSTRSQARRNKTQSREEEESAPESSMRSSQKETPSTVQSGSTENTDSTGTGTESTERSEQSRKDRTSKTKEVRVSREGTVVNRTGPRRASNSVISSSSAQRRAALEARLELERSQKEKADAAVAMAKTKLELIELQDEEDSSDASDVDNSDYVSDWVEKSRQKSIQRQREGNLKKNGMPAKGDVSTLASAIVSAIKSVKESKPAPAPKYINELHHFDGNPREWIAFKAIYRDTEKYFSDIENVARLRRAIKDQARESVKSLLYTNTHPKEILEALERRFGRPTHLIKSEIAAINKLPPMSNDIKGIGIFASAVANSVNVIKQMNRKDYLYSSDLSEKIIDKMNMNVKFRWYEYRSSKEDEPILISLSEFLNNIADQFEAYDVSTTEFVKKKREPFRSRPLRSQKVNTTNFAQSDSESDTETENNYDSDSEFERERAITLNETPVKEREDIVLATTGGKQQPITCLVCKKEHGLVKCPQFLKETVKNRWEIVKKLKVCFKCLKSNHRHSTCKANPCGENNCTRQHHALLHEKPEKEELKIASVNHLNSTKAYLKIVPVELCGPTGTKTVAALLDEGSTVTLLLNEVADEIGADGPTEVLTIEGISGQQMKTNNSRQLKLRIKGLFARNYENLRAYTINELNLTSQSVRQDDIAGCVHLYDIQDQIQYERMKPAILIGQDNWHLIVTRELKSGNSNQPVASLTSLGWILHGCRSEAPKPVSFVGHLQKKNEDIECLIKSHFDLDSLGITPKKPASDPEQRALAILDKTTKRLSDGRFECGLLWRTDNETMPNNRANAMQRLIGIEKKIAKNEDFRKKYTEQIQNLLASGYAEPATSQPTSSRTWYLPHFAVVHPQKGKMRLVFDAAARTNGKSLNDALLSGPDLLQSLFGVLIRFRGGPIAVAADIKEMFLRVGMREEDRDSLRFLWRENETDSEPREYRMKSLIFGATSSPCSAIYVKDRNAQEFSQEQPDAVYAIQRCHYMDDYLQSFQTVTEAKNTAQQVDRIHRAGGFVLRGWASNDTQAIESFEKNSQTDQVPLGQDQTEKTLGMLWNVKKDAMQYTLNLRNTPQEVKEGVRPPSKREVTSAVMSVFDPLGLATPVLIQGKKLIQQLWRAGTDWDESIPDTLMEDWMRWLDSLEHLQHLDIPRCTSSCEEGELHTFVDASESSYAAATYWKTTENNKTSVRLLAAKAKVTPLKPTSIPRLELQAALLGCRLATNIQKEIQTKVTKRYFWSDSRTVLAWIKADPRTFKPFVAHRLAEIEDSTKPTEWRWIPTDENVADDATRSTPRNFTIHHRWFNGPEFLQYNSNQWPEDKSDRSIPTTGEEKSKIVATIRRTEIPIPDVSRFSSWTRLQRATARLLHSVDIFKAKVKEKPEPVAAIKKTVKDKSWRKYERKRKQTPIERAPTITTRTVPLPVEYLQYAETLLVKAIQQESWASELKSLRNNHVPNEKDSRLKRLTLTLRNDIIRIETRISSADCVSDTYKEPIVLDGKHPITKLLIQQYHCDYNHANHNTVMNEIRQKYYITSLRNTLKSITRECDWCRTHKYLPIPAPMGDLPPERLQQHQPPFTCTGVDYFGPLIISVGRKQEKRWVALYTCLTTRAVHLEIVPSLSADSMILSLRRMIARRGAPSIMYSDNGTNFVGANKDMQMELKKLTDKAQQKGIKWKFIPAGAPNMGGAWERLVRSVKVALSATLKSRQPREEVLHTILLEAEHLINSRPLTDVSLDPQDKESLTPNHFLIGRSSGNVIMGTFDDKNLIGTANWKTVQRLTDLFWNRWLTEYLPTITPRYSANSKGFTNPEVGDIVFIIDSSLPRGVWPRGQITHTYPGPDGKVRVVDVRTTAGELRRPTSRIVKIA